MEISLAKADICMRDVLRALQFKEDWTVISDELPGYVYDFGNLELTATQLTNRYFQPVFQLSGIMQDARSLALVDFAVPLMVESFEQGTALIAYAVLHHQIHLKRPPAWLARGREWQDQLPWVREMNAYKARPQCEVDRQWMRVAARKFREIAPKVDPDDLVWLRFDGSLLRIATRSTGVDLMATGTAWQEDYFIVFSDLLQATKRLMQLCIVVSIWEERLEFGSWHLPLARRPP